MMYLPWLWFDDFLKVAFDNIFHIFYNYIQGATKYGRTVVLHSGSISPVYIETFLRNLVERRTYCMITVSLQSIYYIFAIASTVIAASHKLGYENGKNARK